MKFNIITLGCKVNAYESEVIKEEMLKNNFIDAELECSDIVIINTCSVTNMADNKSKKQVRHAKRLGKILVVCGCSAENNQSTYKELGIDILIGNKDKSKIPQFIKEYLQTKEKIIKFYNLEKYEFEDMKVEKFTSHTRAFVKIQDGCNNYCSYCIIPYTRKNLRSKDFDKCLKEIQALVNNGHKEIVLTGIHTGAYQSNGYTLSDLIREISKIKGIVRIRISSIEITEINDKLMYEIKNNSKIAAHLHIPLQSGSDEILKIMNRKYNIDYFKKKIYEIRSFLPDISITTDIIVGHPYETEELFLETLKNSRELNFQKIHVFPYSKRSGTPSSTMPMQVDDNTKKCRSKILNSLSKELEIKYYQKHLNNILEVLIEEVYENYSLGFTSNYIKIRVNQKLIHNEIYKVHILEFTNNELIGIIID